jgi:hypothetical protein
MNSSLGAFSDVPDSNSAQVGQAVFLRGLRLD